MDQPSVLLNNANGMLNDLIKFRDDVCGPCAVLSREECKRKLDVAWASGGVDGVLREAGECKKKMRSAEVGMTPERFDVAKKLLARCIEVRYMYRKMYFRREIRNAVDEATKRLESGDSDRVVEARNLLEQAVSKT